MQNALICDSWLEEQAIIQDDICLIESEYFP